MINLAEVLSHVPPFRKFCSVADLNALVTELSHDGQFKITEAGRSVSGRPIHHVRFGSGSLKVLFVGFPHCMEPIGGLTVFSLLTLLAKRLPTLVEADVEWNVVPCIDPDGAILNEAWTQSPVTTETLRDNFYAQAPRDQVDMSFPVHHKSLAWDAPSPEARVLMGILDKVTPDFFYSLHNAWTGGAFYFVSQDLGASCYSGLYGMLRSLDFPLSSRPFWREFCAQYSDGVAEMFSIRKHYDYLALTSPTPEKFFRWGATSFEYLAQIKPDAVSFVSEMGYVRHPDDESNAPTGENLRKFKLKIDAENKYLATVIGEEWEKVKDHVSKESPFYNVMFGGTVLPDMARLHEGGRPISRYTTQDLLTNPEYNREMTKGDRFDACFNEAFFFHLFSHQFVQLLETSPQAPAIDAALGRLRSAYADAQALLDSYVDPSRFYTVDCNTLAKAQLGSGLVVLNSLLGRT
jgi:hypothetical protein